MPSTPNPRAYQLRAKTKQVVDYHNDDAKPGKPLRWLIPGGLIALASLALIIYLAYVTFLDQTMAQGQGIGLMLLLAPFYIGGVFVFSYGYELYDTGKAIRLTAIIVFITVAAVVIVAVLFLLLGNSKGGGSKSSGKSDSKSSSKSSGGGILDGILGGSSSSSSSGSGSGSGGGGGGYFNPGPIIIGGGTNTVTREVVREVPVAPPQPIPIRCPNCGTSYLPKDNKFQCPACGAPTPQEMIAESMQGAPDDETKEGK